MNFLQELFSSDGFMPHGHCYLWNRSMMWLNVISDGLIALAYLTIPVTLVYIARKRKDLPFDWMFACFGIFILACGATHALEIWTLWIPTYWLLGTTKAITAAASVATAILLARLIPQLLAIPSPTSLRKVNAALLKEVAERRHAEEALLQQQTELRVLFDLMPAMICFKDTQNGILRANQRLTAGSGSALNQAVVACDANARMVDRIRFPRKRFVKAPQSASGEEVNSIQSQLVHRLISRMH